MKLEFYGLAQTIRKLAKNKPVTFVVNPGNWGDALIRAGTIEFFNHFNIDYREIFLREENSIKRNALLLRAKAKNRLLVISGGGAWCSHYSHLAESVKGIQARYSFDNILVLPSTFDKPFEIPGVQFYRRDEYESKTAMPNAEFCHDMAFFLPEFSFSNKVLKKQGQFFRTDVETSNKITLTADNHDLSGDGNETGGVYAFFRYLVNYDEVNTDRLHVSIGASLLGLKVNLYEGCYFKNQAIYKSSLQPFFPNTTFIDFEPNAK